MRWSYTSRAWIGFFAQLPDGRAYLRYELAFREKSPEQAAVIIKAKQREWNIEPMYVAANPELWPEKKNSRGESISETFLRAGIRVIKGSGDRVNRWSRVRSWLDVKTWQNGEQSPSLVIHPSCVVLLRTLPTLVSAKTDPDDIDATPDEYPAEGVGHYAMSRPMPSPDEEPELPVGAIGHSLRQLRESLAHA